MRRVAGTLAVCMVGIVACDSATEPDPCAGVARVGELELFIGSTTGVFEEGEIALVGDTLALFAEVSEVLGVSAGVWEAACVRSNTVLPSRPRLSGRRRTVVSPQ